MNRWVGVLSLLCLWMASGGLGSMDVYLAQTAEEMEVLEPDSDKARVLIKKSKRKSRTTSGR